MRKNLFVVGLDPMNGATLRQIDNYEELAVHPLLAYDEVKGRDAFSFDALLDTARRRLRAFDGSVDGIAGWWDFPTTSLVPALCEEFGLPGASLESVLKCEHKYWSRLAQWEVVPDYVPRFCAVDPFKDHPLSDVSLDFPFWIKPIKGFASQLGFRIGNVDDFDSAITIIREEIPRLGDPFDELLRQAELPPEIAAIGGNFCIVEEIIGGLQCTLEGYVYRGDARVYGAVDSIRHPNRSSFMRYQYPSKLPKRAQRRMQAIAKRVMIHVGYDNAPFNVEFFWDPRRQKLSLLEVNPRLSQSHASIFAKVHGVPNFQIMVDLALGREPHWVGREGPANCAAKFFIRRFSDALVRSVPEPQTIAEIKADLPGTEIDIRVRPGILLSDLHDQDTYSYELADVFMSAASQQELLRNFRRVRNRLKFRFARPSRKRKAPVPEMASRVA